MNHHRKKKKHQNSPPEPAPPWRAPHRCHHVLWVPRRPPIHRSARPRRRAWRIGSPARTREKRRIWWSYWRIYLVENVEICGKTLSYVIGLSGWWFLCWKYVEKTSAAETNKGKCQILRNIDIENWWDLEENRIFQGQLRTTKLEHAFIRFVLKQW